MKAVGDPVRLGKAWAWVLLGVAMVFLWKLAVRLEGPACGFLAVVMFLHMPGLPLTLSGIPHTYAWPLLAAFLWFQEVERPRAAVVCVVLAGLFYPPLALLCCALFVVRRAGLEGLRPVLRDRHIWALAGAMAVTLVVIFPWDLLVSSGDRVTWLSYEGRFARDAAIESGEGLPPANLPLDEVELPFESVLEIAARDVMDPAGQPLMTSGDSLLTRSTRWSFRLAPALLALIVLCGAVFGGRRFARPPRIVVELLLVSTGVYLLAVLCALYLFVPDRYLRYSLPIASGLYLAVLGARAAARLPRKLQVIAVTGGVALYLLAMGTGIARDSEWSEDFGDAAGLMQFLAATAPDTRIAGPLSLMDAVELFADRETFAFCQEALSTTDGLDGPAYENLRGRVAALHGAYYAEQPQDVLEFMERSDVDLLVLRQGSFEVEWLRDVHGTCELPANTAAALAARRPVFALQALPLELMVYSDENGYQALSRERLDWYVQGD